MIEMIEIRCPHCCSPQDTTDWTESFTFNEEIFEVECGRCERPFSVKVDITPEYEVINENQD